MPIAKTAPNITFGCSYNYFVFRDYDNVDSQAVDVPEMHDGDTVDANSLTFSCGTLEQLNYLVRLIYMIGTPGVATGRLQSIEIHTGSAFIQNEPGIVPESSWVEVDIAALTESQKELLQIALRLNRPMGQCSIYNDNWYDARPIAIRFALEEPSMHEQAEARGTLRQLLGSHVSKKDLDRLIPET